MKIKELEMLKKVYGGNSTLNQVLEKELSKTPYRCPKCNGAGVNSVICNDYPVGVPGSSRTREIKYENVDCDLCDGLGYTAKEYKPKMVQQGWE